MDFKATYEKSSKSKILLQKRKNISSIFAKNSFMLPNSKEQRRYVKTLDCDSNLWPFLQFKYTIAKQRDASRPRNFNKADWALKILKATYFLDKTWPQNKSFFLLAATVFSCATCHYKIDTNYINIARKKTK